MCKTLIGLITIAALAISVNVASAQKGGGRGSHGGGGGSAAVGGGGSRGGPGPSFSAPSGNVRGYSRSMGGYNPGGTVHAPRLSPGIVQHQYRAMPKYRVSPGIVQHQYRATQKYRVSPRVVQRVPRYTSQAYTQRKMQTLGAHHRRYRHRRRGYAYYYGGWWYAYPWWLESYSDYDYWSSVCAYRWGYYTPGFYRCMAYYGFY
jgi:hypothetical protein